MVQSIRSLMLLVGTYYFLQAIGGNPGLHSQAVKKYLKEGLDFTTAETALFFAAITIPWMLKPLYGLISDFLPIFGSRRKSYFIFAGALAASAYGALWALGVNAETLKICLFLAAIGFAFSDVLCDATMIEKGQPLNATGSLQSVQWGTLYAAGIIIAVSQGYIAQYMPLETALLLPLATAIVMIGFTAIALTEPKIDSAAEASRLAWSGVRQAIRSKPIWAAAVFIFLYNCAPSLGDSFYYYEKDVLGFSDVMIGYVAMTSSIGGVIGAVLFSRITQSVPHRRVMQFVIVGGVIGTLLYLFFRDVTSAFVISGIAGTVGLITLLGILTHAARVCPKYAEGTVFALLMSVSNFGSQVGNVTGGFLYSTIGYTSLVLLSAAATLAMWFALRLVQED